MISTSTVVDRMEEAMILDGDALILDAFEKVDGEYATSKNPNPTRDARKYYTTLQEALKASEQALLLFADPFGNVGDFQRYPMNVTIEQMKAISRALKAIKKTRA